MQSKQLWRKMTQKKKLNHSLILASTLSHRTTARKLQSQSDHDHVRDQMTQIAKKNAQTKIEIEIEAKEEREDVTRDRVLVRLLAEAAMIDLEHDQDRKNAIAIDLEPGLGQEVAVGVVPIVDVKVLIVNIRVIAEVERALALDHRVEIIIIISHAAVVLVHVRRLVKQRPLLQSHRALIAHRAVQIEVRVKKNRNRL